MFRSILDHLAAFKPISKASALAVLKYSCLPLNCGRTKAIGKSAHFILLYNVSKSQRRMTQAIHNVLDWRSVKFNLGKNSERLISENYRFETDV